MGGWVDIGVDWCTYMIGSSMDGYHRYDRYVTAYFI